MSSLPPGQRRTRSLPRFGLPWFVVRVPKVGTSLTLAGTTMSLADIALERVRQSSDLHCVTTWSCTALAWEGWRFRDLYQQLLASETGTEVRIHGADGYLARLPLEDALADDVILATHLGGEPLTLAHGAPLRFVAPAHYGYKNVKHVTRIELVDPALPFRGPSPRFMEHPRARVAHEERGRLPAWLLRLIYRPLVRPGFYLGRRTLR